MPIYEYNCGECGKNFEQIRRFSDPPLEACSVCGAPDPTKLVSASAFHLKGTGWYATDYGPSGGRAGVEKPTTTADNAPAASAESTTDSSSEKKAETKPAPKSEVSSSTG